MEQYLSIWTGPSWPLVAAALGAGLALTVFNLYLTSSVLHRGICHKAISYPAWLTRTVAAWLWLTECVPPLSWVAAHLHHHATSDTAEDPHAPIFKGFWHVFLFTWYYVPEWYRGNMKMAETRYLRRFQKERVLHFLDRPAIANGNFYLQLILSVLFGPVTLAFWLARIVPYMLGSGYVNSVGHTHGERPHENLGTDARGFWQTLFGYYVGGESLGHNYHHYRPASSTFRPAKFDPGHWFATRILRGDPRPTEVEQ
ncbi:MAG: fatty acid desaturase [Gemmatimonadales bacterium]